jgi:hypothetical protein
MSFVIAPPTPGRVLQMWSEELVAYLRRFRGVWFTTCEEAARWHAEGKTAATTRGEKSARWPRAAKRNR